jgi:2-oxoglutarate dehydrogenase E2 component (dihydrolipoamide succinyltransferase)
MHEITVPQVNSNDEAYILVEWLAADGAELAPDSPVAVLETSKTAEELAAEASGFLQQQVAVGAECRVGTVIGRLFPTEQARTEYLAAVPREASGTSPAADVVITKSAAAAAADLGVGADQLASLGKRVIKRQDVEALAARAGVTEIRLSAAQQAIADVVTRSHQSIPAAFLAVKVPADAALRLRAVLAGESPADIGLPELLVKAVAGLRERFPLCFGSYRADGTVSVIAGAHTGITLDLGHGLYVPVIKHADRLPLTEIASVLADLRISALRGSFRDADLSGGNITISLSNDPDTVLARPIVFPGQTCMLCLCGTQQEVYLTSAGTLDVRHVAHLGISYDHRVINGRDASDFLHELKRALAEPHGLLAAHAGAKDVKERSE